MILRAFPVLLALVALAGSVCGCSQHKQADMPPAAPPAVAPLSADDQAAADQAKALALQQH